MQLFCIRRRKKNKIEIILQENLLTSNIKQNEYCLFLFIITKKQTRKKKWGGIFGEKTKKQTKSTVCVCVSQQR